MEPQAANPLDVFRDYACVKLREYAAQIERCLGLLSDAQVWQRPNQHSNSVANLVLHLCGNVTQWILGGLGGGAEPRDRPAEFAARGGASAAELAARMRGVVAEACCTIERLDHAMLSAPVAIQGYATTGLAAAFHVTEHFAFHAGQIIWATKAILDVDLSLYDAQGRRLDARTGPIP